MPFRNGPDSKCALSFVQNLIKNAMIRQAFREENMIQNPNSPRPKKARQMKNKIREGR
jgi:hypothetical protein